MSLLSTSSLEAMNAGTRVVSAKMELMAEQETRKSGQ